METWGRYWVEVLGGVLIFVSSWVTMTDWVKGRLTKYGWALFGILAIGYIALSISVDRAAFRKEDAERSKLERQNKDLSDHVTTLIAMIGTGTDKLNALQTDTSAIRIQLSQHDPKLLAEVKSEITKNQESAARLAKTNLLAMAPIIADQIESIGGAWFGLADNQTLSLQEITDYRPDTPENRAKAQKIREQMAASDAIYEPKIRVLHQQASDIQDAILKLIPESQHTTEDEQWSRYFRDPPMRRIAPADEVAYLRNLVKRLEQAK